MAMSSPIRVALVAKQKPWFGAAIRALYFCTLAVNAVSPRLAGYVRERGVSLIVRKGWDFTANEVRQ